MHREGTPSGVLLPLTREIPWYGTIDTHWLLRLLTPLQLVLLTKTEAIPPMIYTHFSNAIDKNYIALTEESKAYFSDNGGIVNVVDGGK